MNSGIWVAAISASGVVLASLIQYGTNRASTRAANERERQIRAEQDRRLAADREVAEKIRAEESAERQRKDEAATRAAQDEQLRKRQRENQELLATFTEKAQICCGTLYMALDSREPAYMIDHKEIDELNRLVGRVVMFGTQGQVDTCRDITDKIMGLNNFWKEEAGSEDLRSQITNVRQWIEGLGQLSL